MKSRKVLRLLADRRIAANDDIQKIQNNDVAVADRGHWLGDLEKGKGFTGFEDHPYRRHPRQKVSRYAAVRWPDIHPRPVAANQNVQHTGRPATKEERKSAGEGLPVEVEFKNGRIAGYLWTVAADVRDCYEEANAPVLSARLYGPETGSAVSIERRIKASQACRMIRHRAPHLWRPLIDACVFGKGMAALGREYGGNKEDAAKLGRQKVIDALIIARECFWDLRQFAREDAANINNEKPLQRVAMALGRKANDLPDFINMAANQNLRSIVDVA